ncbi:MAG: hypothetical protein AB7O98_07310 [Hyphomonadaceae bacterium]
MIAALRQRLDALKQWHAALSPRERAGLMVLVLIAGAVLALQSFDWAMSAQARAMQARADLGRVSAAEARSADEAWRSAVAENAGRVWTWSVAEPTENIARARAIAELESLIGAAGVPGATVRPARQQEEDADAPMAAMEYIIEGGFDWYTLVALLDALDDSTLAVTPVAMDVSDSGRFTMTVRMAYLDEDVRT